MNLAVCLLAYALSLTVFGPAMVSRATRAGAAPRWGIGAWLVMMGSVLVTAVTAVAIHSDFQRMPSVTVILN